MAKNKPAMRRDEEREMRSERVISNYRPKRTERFQELTLLWIFTMKRKSTQRDIVLQEDQGEMKFTRSHDQYSNTQSRITHYTANSLH